MTGSLYPTPASRVHVGIVSGAPPLPNAITNKHSGELKFQWIRRDASIFGIHCCFSYYLQRPVQSDNPRGLKNCWT